MNISKVCNSAEQNFKGFNTEKIFSKAANMNSLQQRIALGVSAMTIQPAIDMLNKNVDPSTREVSAKRSLAKGFVGMTTGIIIRGACMKGVELTLSKDKMADKLAKIITPEKTEEALLKTKNYIKNQGGAKQYASVIGTIAALGVMLFTNFLVDAPLTNLLTNKLSKKDNQDENNTKKHLPANKVQKLLIVGASKMVPMIPASGLLVKSPLLNIGWSNGS